MVEKSSQDPQMGPEWATIWWFILLKVSLSPSIYTIYNIKLYYIKFKKTYNLWSCDCWDLKTEKEVWEQKHKQFWNIFQAISIGQNLLLTQSNKTKLCDNINLKQLDVLKVFRSLLMWRIITYYCLPLKSFFFLPQIFVSLGKPKQFKGFITFSDKKEG